MQSGLLSGGLGEERAAALPADDWRSRARDFTGERLRQNLALAASLALIAERHRTTVAAVAVAWTLAWPAVTGAIVGARNAAQVDGWLPAASLTLAPDDLDEIASAITRSGAGDGPARPSH